jgi:DNA-binding MarR family transcriptional regulator
MKERKGYTQWSHVLEIRRDLTWNEKAVLRTLYRFEELPESTGIHPGMNRIADDTGMSAQGVQKIVRRLAQRGFITRTSRRAKGDGHGRPLTNIYTITEAGYEALGAHSFEEPTALPAGAHVDPCEESMVDSRSTPHRERLSGRTKQQEREREPRPSGSAETLSLRAPSGPSAPRSAAPAADAPSGPPNEAISIPPIPPAPPSSTDEVDALVRVFGVLARRRQAQALREEYTDVSADDLVRAIRWAQAHQVEIRRRFRQSPDVPLDPGFFLRDFGRQTMQQALSQAPTWEAAQCRQQELEREAERCRLEEERTRPEREAREARARALVRDVEARLQPLLPEDVREHASFPGLAKSLTTYEPESVVAYCTEGLQQMFGQFPNICRSYAGTGAQIPVLHLMQEKINLGHLKVNVQLRPVRVEQAAE